MNRLITKHYRLRPRGRQAGVTLIELVVAITIVAVSVTTVLGAFGAIATSSADAMVQHQATAIAESYLEEITLKPFGDPDGADDETGRADFDDVDDYGGLSESGPRDPDGNVIAGLADYTVSVVVDESDALAPLAAGVVRRIDISVVHASGMRVALTGYRVSY
jgi:MSHA pilin protein MshD